MHQVPYVLRSHKHRIHSFPLKKEDGKGFIFCGGFFFPVEHFIAPS